TGAAAAVSAKWMARKNSKRLAIVGAGHMAEGTLATCNEIFAWEEVRIWSRTQATLDHFLATQQPKFRKLKIKRVFAESSGRIWGMKAQESCAFLSDFGFQRGLRFGI